MSRIVSCKVCGKPKAAADVITNRRTCRQCHAQEMRRYRARADVIELKLRRRLARNLRLIVQYLDRQHIQVDEVICPTCNARPTTSDGPEWAHAWGHRCCHGEPCPGWASPKGHEVCTRGHDVEDEQEQEPKLRAVVGE